MKRNGVDMARFFLKTAGVQLSFALNAAKNDLARPRVLAGRAETNAP